MFLVVFIVCLGFLVSCATGASQVFIATESELQMQIARLQQTNAKLEAKLQRSIDSEDHERAAAYENRLIANDEQLDNLARSLWEMHIEAIEAPSRVLDNISTLQDVEDQIQYVSEYIEYLRKLRDQLTFLRFEDFRARLQKVLTSYRTALDELIQKANDFEMQELQPRKTSAVQIPDSAFYSSKSRTALKNVIGDFLAPHQEFIVGARNKLLEILDDASSRGVQNVKLWSKLSEVGFVNLCYLSAGGRFREIVSSLRAMHGVEFGSLLARSNEDLVVKNGGINGDPFLCTFGDLMKTGECSCKGRVFGVVYFEIVSGGTFGFYTLERLTLEESEHNIERNIQQLTSVNAVFAQTEKRMREFLYEHLYSPHMFHFRVYYDGVEQANYSSPGKGAYVSQLLHWEITHKQLVYELVAKNYSLGRGFSAGTVEVNQTEFNGLPDHFLQGYRLIPDLSTEKRGGVFVPQVLEVHLWGDLKDDLITEVHQRNMANKQCILC